MFIKITNQKHIWLAHNNGTLLCLNIDNFSILFKQKIDHCINKIFFSIPPDSQKTILLLSNTEKKLTILLPDQQPYTMEGIEEVCKLTETEFAILYLNGNISIYNVSNNTSRPLTTTTNIIFTN